MAAYHGKMQEIRPRPSCGEMRVWRANGDELTRFDCIYHIKIYHQFSFSRQLCVPVYRNRWCDLLLNPFLDDRSCQV